MKRPPKIKFIPYEEILKMKFPELKENGFISKKELKYHSEDSLKNFGFELLFDLELINERKVTYNQIREHIVWYWQFGMLVKEAIERVAADFYISPKSINHILYRGNK